MLFRSAFKKKKSTIIRSAMGKEVNKYVYHYLVKYLNENNEEEEKRYLTAKQIQKDFAIGKTTFYNYKKERYNLKRKNPKLIDIIKLNPPEKVNITVLYFD